MKPLRNILKNKCNLSGKLALITGGGSGIGFGIAESLSEAGAGIIIVGRNQEKLEKAIDKLNSTGHKAEYLVFDLSNIKSIESFYQEKVIALGSPDILINNAAINIRGPIQEISIENWQRVIDVNLTAVFVLSQVWSNDRIKRGLGGKIINIASLMTVAVRPTCGPYAVSKGAIGLLTKAFAVELAKYGITVNAIGPGYIRTEMNKQLYEDPDFNRWVLERAPMKRWGEIQDIGKVSIFLSSDLSDYITGQIIYVDGGWLAAL